MKKVTYSWRMYEVMIARIIEEMGLSGKEEIFMKEGMKVFHQYIKSQPAEAVNDYSLHNEIRKHFRSLMPY
ncbi:hypothetical protein [Halobacillus massiliensis]|uniref:hypothetical protein n=1 Tax=Halobacillus massiliensis TaxID=1926286 RepID=UPI0009E19C8A|nr:hypothetical protein [Halobacillus massiliensis]